MRIITLNANGIRAAARKGFYSWDLYQIYALCERDGNDFNLAYIPVEFTEEPSEMFDPVYMGKLYKLGYRLASKGYPWVKAPPGFIIDE